MGVFLMYFAYAAAFFVIIPTSLGCLRYRQLSMDIKPIVWFLVLSTVTEFCAVLFTFIRINNFPILHVFTLIEFACMTYIFNRFINRVISTKVLTGIAIAFSIGSILNSIFLQSLFTFNTYARGVEFLFILFYALVLMYELSTQTKGSFKNNPVFWFAMAVLIYYASSFFVVIGTNMLIQHMKIVWAVHNVFLVIHYILFCKVLWIK